MIYNNSNTSYNTCVETSCTSDIHADKKRLNKYVKHDKKIGVKML